MTSRIFDFLGPFLRKSTPQEQVGKPKGKPKRTGARLINQRHRLIYAPIAKNACTFLKRLLVEQSDFGTDYIESGLDIHDYVARNDSLRLQDVATMDDPTWMRFVVFRDPIDRAVSAYLDRFVRYRAYPGAVELTREHLMRLGREPGDQELLSFSQFVDAICEEQDDAKLDAHWRSQRWFVLHDLAKFEWQVSFTRLAELIDVLAKRMGVEIVNEKTSHRNVYGTYRLEDRLFEKAPVELRKLATKPSKDALVTGEMLEKLRHRFAPDFDLHAQSIDASMPRE